MPNSDGHGPSYVIGTFGCLFYNPKRLTLNVGRLTYFVNRV